MSGITAQFLALCRPNQDVCSAPVSDIMLQLVAYGRQHPCQVAHPIVVVIGWRSGVLVRRAQTGSTFGRSKYESTLQHFSPASHRGVAQHHNDLNTQSHTATEPWSDIYTTAYPWIPGTIRTMPAQSFRRTILDVPSSMQRRQQPNTRAVRDTWNRSA